MVINSLFPVFSLIILGYVLKHYHLTNDVFLKNADRLLYFIFFPTMLFWKIAGTEPVNVIHWTLIFSVISAVATVYLLSCIGIKIFNIQPHQVGTYSQSCYRFNSYIGMAIIISVLGDEGVRQFSVIISIAIPIINVLSVCMLIWYSGMHYSLGEKSRFTIRALVSNPLILGCLTGILYSRTRIPMPIFLDNTLGLISSITLPLAFLSIGGTLTFQKLKTHYKLSIVGSIYKLLLLPVIGYFFLKACHISGIPFKTGMIFFALPTSSAIYALSSQLNSDTDLASATIVLSLILSFVPLSIVLLI